MRVRFRYISATGSERKCYRDEERGAKWWKCTKRFIPTTFRIPVTLLWTLAHSYTDTDHRSTQLGEVSMQRAGNAWNRQRTSRNDVTGGQSTPLLFRSHTDSAKQKHDWSKLQKGFVKKSRLHTFFHSDRTSTLAVCTAQTGCLVFGEIDLDLRSLPNILHLKDETKRDRSQGKKTPWDDVFLIRKTAIRIQNDVNTSLNLNQSHITNSQSTPRHI